MKRPERIWARRTQIEEAEKLTAGWGTNNGKNGVTWNIRCYYK
jgi:hypothetical protein